MQKLEGHGDKAVQVDATEALSLRQEAAAAKANSKGLPSGSKVSALNQPLQPVSIQASNTLIPVPTPTSVPTEILEPSAEDKDPLVPVLVNPEFAGGEIALTPDAEVTVLQSTSLKRLNDLDKSNLQLSKPSDTHLLFELPVTYNARVKSWVQYFQTIGRGSFKTWLERSTRWLPYIHDSLEAAGLPEDLAYIAMIESGFKPDARSPANAVGMWQFIRATGNRYGLKTTWWLDERRDVNKSTQAAVRHIRDLYRVFNSWYLVAASYNMGENGVQRLIKRHGQSDFWELADIGALPRETTDYVPKILAAMLIAKAPALYGFRDLQYLVPYSYEYHWVPGGTDLTNLASYLGVSGKYLQELNPELIRGFIPQEISGHRIRIPKGAVTTVSQYVKMQTNVSTN